MLAYVEGTISPIATGLPLKPLNIFKKNKKAHNK
jgi:hypothetical protein